MITQIEIDGFKTFKDFKVELAPFQVIVGPNGSGKSNLFDALHLLSRLAEFDLQAAFQSSPDDPQRLRGDAHDLFTLFPDGQRSKRIRMAVEMLVERKVQDDFGSEVELSNTRLRYELEIVLREDKPDWEALHVTHEALRSIPEHEDRWSKRYGPAENGWLPAQATEQKVFISTPQSHGRVAEAAALYDSDPDEPSVSPTIGRTMVYLHADGQGRGRTLAAHKMKRTVLSSMIDTAFPHAYAVREEMRSWRFLHLNQEALRQPASTKAGTHLLPNGANLPAVLARIRAEDSFAFHCVWMDIANLVPGILELQVEKDQTRGQYVITVKDEDERAFSGNVLSDGTLRLLALATVRNDPQYRGVLCLEEPENGVNPLRVKNMVRLLREMTTDFKDEQQKEVPLRQVLIATHSPTLISQPDARDSLLLAYTVMRVEPQTSRNQSMEVTRMTPVIPAKIGVQIRGQGDEHEDKAVEAYTIHEIKRYLDSGSLVEAGQQLDEARNAL